MGDTLTIYIAHPLGFSPLLKPSLDRIIDELEEIGFDVIDPFKDCAEYGASIGLDPIEIPPNNIEKWDEFNKKVIGPRNDESMEKADACYAIFDIDDPGTAADAAFFASVHNYKRPIFGANARFLLAENIATHTNPAAVNPIRKTEPVGGGMFEGFQAHENALEAARVFYSKFMPE